MNLRRKNPGRGVGRSPRARHGEDVSTRERFEVGRTPVWQWLVHGRTGGSKQLTTEGKVADQARLNGRRPADIVLRKERLHSGRRERRCAHFHKLPLGLVDPQTNGNCVCLHESSDTAVSLESTASSRGLPILVSGDAKRRWERPIPIPNSANKTLESYWCLNRVPGGYPSPGTHSSRRGPALRQKNLSFVVCTR